MLAVLSSLIVLAVLWMIAAVALRMVEESGGKILAALKGGSDLSAPQYVAAPIRVRLRSTGQQRPVSATPRQRAAA